MTDNRKFALFLLALTLLSAAVGWYLTPAPLPATDSPVLLRDELFRLTGQ